MASRKVVRLARQGVVALAIRFISAVLGYALLVVLARWMGADEFGRFGVAFSLATTVGIICGGGQRRLVLRFVAAYCARGREDLLRPLLRTSLAATAAAAGLAAGAIALTALLLSLDASFYPAALLAAAMIVSDYQSHALRGMGSLTLALIPREIAWRPAAIAVMAAVGGGISIVTDAATALWFLASMLSVLTALQFWFVARRYWRRTLDQIKSQGEDPEPDETVEQARLGWRSTAARLWAVSALNQGMNPLSVVIVGAFLPPAETGAFFAAVRVATTVAFPAQALDILTAPKISHAYASNDHARLQQITSFTATASSIAALLGAGVLSLFGRHLLALMDPMFVSAFEMQLLVMGGFMISAFCGSGGYLMTMTGHERQFLKILATGNGLGLVAITVLVWAIGAVGAAIGLSLCIASWNVAAVVWARRNLRIDPSVAGALFPPARPGT